ncbi:glycosyltransferase family 1 protein [Polynucleobacter sp. MG-Unter2-18]|uniref:CgeB family protein n=1 Tax=Polynucleobacter sp. MG-Unter2-18 TaxID=2081052 RepID=UPI001BFD43C3|nr:glycosyltransferase [Polynucleobacter sp. MG-Unter2-18]QWD94874.1 glycosyltransferase family 1 protein [Polynucleobacter sp. MG-Unter2-18]
MRVLLLDTYYPAFLRQIYSANVDLAKAGYAVQRDFLLDQCFGTSDFYSRHLNELGCEAQNLIANCVPLQNRWAQEAGISVFRPFLEISPRLYRLPHMGRLLARLPGLQHLVSEQIRQFKPDVLYCQDINFLVPETLQALKKSVPLIVGQIASPLPAAPFCRGYDLILTSFPHFVPGLRALGVAAEFFRIGFDPSILERLGSVEKDIPASFVGGIGRHHGKAVPTLEYLARKTPIEFFGYGVENLDPQSPIRLRHHGEVWGLDMYRALARSRITMNRHISAAENNANNMRLYEATGVGTLLLTDRKDNLGELFEIGKEVLAYESPEEAASIISHYLNHPAEAAVIARAGQARTLSEHSYAARMVELFPILKAHLGQKGH